MIIDAITLRRTFVYDAATGLFYRVGRYPARPSGRINSRGYVTLKINGRTYFAHRLAWLYIYGEWPSAIIDHINRERDDNRLHNLRDVSSSQNNLNRTIDTKGRGVSGRKGITVLKRKDGTFRYQATMCRDGDVVYLGLFDDIEDAAVAYEIAAAKRNIR
jgi:hypothetical protein